MSFFSSVLDILFPSFCAGCGATQESGRAMCGPCLDAIPFFETLFCGRCRARLPANLRICHPEHPCLLGTAASYGNEPIRSLIHSLKFGNVRSAADPLGILLARYAKRLALSVPDPLVIPVPLGTRRMRERGFNQSDLIARRFATELELPFANGVLMRTRETKPQHTLDAETRRTNVRGCFSATEAVAGRNIFLVDDVVTSGATAAAAAEALKIAGGKRIIAFAPARA